MAISALDMALIETIREVAALLDTARATSVATDYDAYREDVVTRSFNLARAATEARRTCRPGNH